jgi:hypothetical protein
MEVWDTRTEVARPTYVWGFLQNAISSIIGTAVGGVYARSFVPRSRLHIAYARAGDNCNREIPSECSENSGCALCKE